MTTEQKPSSNGADAPASLRAEKLIGGGRALAHHDGETWMVAGALPGETVLAQPTRRRAGIIEAETLEVLESPHDARDRDPCPHSDRCGGCDWPHIKAGEAARFKALAASDAARGMPVLAALLAEAPIATSPLNYRLRARLHWDPETRRLGFYETRSQRVTSIDSCTILSPELMSAIPSISDVLAGRCPHRVDVEWLQSLEPGDAIAGLRAARGGPVQLDPSWIPDRENLGAAVSGFHSLDRSGEIHAGWGATAVTMDLPTPLRVPIGAFFQGNRHLIRALYQRIADLAGSSPEPIYDLHAGVGFLAAAALANGEREAHLVEPHRIAARAAALNLPAASVAVGQTAENYVGSAADLPGEALVITDPPRSGLTRPLRESLVRWQPRRVLMLGCDPATWARDAGHLVAAGYQVRSIELFDLFPSTHHVEILALLERT